MATNNPADKTTMSSSVGTADMADTAAGDGAAMEALHSAVPSLWHTLQCPK